MKAFIKELFIVLLILAVILLVLGVFLYDYIPTNKIVPKIEQYQVPNNIKKELDDYVTEEEQQKTQIVYEIDGTDLKNYEKTNDYQKGKVNPFAQDSLENTTDNNKNNNINNDTNNKNSTNTNKTTNTKPNNSTSSNNSNSVGNYLPNTGTK